MKTRIIGAIIALILTVVGAFLLVTYVRGADARAQQGAELADVYVVTEEIPSGTPGESVGDFVKLDSAPQRNIPEGAVTKLSELNGLVADGKVFVGEQLLVAQFVSPAEKASRGDVDVPAGMQEVSFALPVQRMVGGAIRSGSKIGLVVTKYEAGVDIKDGTPTFVPESQFSFNGVLVTNAQIGENVSDGDSSEGSETSGDTILLTVALATHDAERLVWAMEGNEQAGDYIPYVGLWATLQNEATDTSGSAPVNESNLR
ncbi:Flp pilus assembly protein CpaB [Agromyces italicus]|uniref:Flp pilus assembly protein CpaB n=1 Tax=Agromyces italicus TaxID=279572 RepID=UPI0003B64B9E|nr:Flp pilus assembly protein CpaB [Agromyces italicus]